MKIVGMDRRLKGSWAYNSTPDMPGKRTSRIKHAKEPRGWADCKNSSAEANSAAPYPTDSARAARDSRTDSSSSTTAMTGTPDVLFISVPIAPVGHLLPVPTFCNLVHLTSAGVKPSL